MNINYNFDFDYIDFNNDNFEDKLLNIIKNKDINNSKNNRPLNSNFGFEKIDNFY